MPADNDETIDRILCAFSRSDDPVLTASEIANQIGISRRTALRKLNRLEEEEKIKRKEVGGRAVVWWSTLE